MPTEIDDTDALVRTETTTATANATVTTTTDSIVQHLGKQLTNEVLGINTDTHTPLRNEWYSRNLSRFVECAVSTTHDTTTITIHSDWYCGR